MPTMADITVKKADGVTLVTYAKKRAAAGDDTPAQWALDSASSFRNLRPSLMLSSRRSGTNGARRVDMVLRHPIVRSIDGVDTKIGDLIFTSNVVVPPVVTDLEAQEAAAQGANLLSAALIQECIVAGYSPT